MIVKAVNTFLDAGLSVMPIIMPEKKPSQAWKQYQSRLPQKNELDFSNSGAALICGSVSGNVEVIDIDAKNDPTLVERFDEAVQHFCADVLTEENVVIQRTISGGLHIIYKCDVIEGNLKLAKNESGLVLVETRGEGGYIVIDPTPGYSIVLGDLTKIPQIAPEQRTRLMDACKSLNRYYQQAYTPKTSALSADDDSPGNVYNRTGKLEALIEPLGWKYSHEYKGNQYWRRPEKKIGHSASWNGTHFYVWTSSTTLESERAYTLFALRTYLQFNGDFSACASQLLKEGYGTAPKQTSANELTKGVQKKSNGQATKDHTYVYLIPSIRATNKFSHIFVSRDNICQYYESNASGKASELLKERLARELNESEWPKIVNEGLPLFNESWVQRDTEDSIYLYYKNGSLQIFADKTIFTEGEDRAMVWDSLILDRDYKTATSIHEISELAKKVAVDYETLQIGLGYLLHRHWKRNAAKIVWAVDYMPQSRNDGRRGKDLFTSIVSLCRKWVPVKWKKDHNFWTSSISPDTAIVHFEDVSPFLATDDEFKKTITGNLNVEYKGANIQTLKFEDKPKFSASSQQYPADFMDDSIRGRLWIVEFTDYLQQNPPQKVLVYDDKDLAAFDRWIIDCCQVYLKNKHKLIGTPKITPEQRQQALRLKYGKSLIAAVDEVRNELQIERFITSEALFEIISGGKSNGSITQKFLDCYFDITGERLEAERAYLSGVRKRIYKIAKSA